MNAPVPTDFREEIIRTITETIKTVGLTSEPLPSIPPPSDIESEVRLIGALLSSECELSEIRPFDLEADAFMLPLHRWLWGKIETAEEAGLTLSFALLSSAARAEGLAIDPEIEWLFSQPVCFRDGARDAALRVVEMWHRRRLLVALDRICLAVRTGQMDVVRGIAALEKLLNKARGTLGIAESGSGVEL